MSNFGLEFSFGIDNGELDGIPPNHVFVLGFELGQIWDYLSKRDTTAPYFRNVRVENKDRIERMFLHFGRRCRLTFSAEDNSESWLWLEALNPGQE